MGGEGWRSRLALLHFTRDVTMPAVAEGLESTDGGGLDTLVR